MIQALVIGQKSQKVKINTDGNIALTNLNGCASYLLTTDFSSTHPHIIYPLSEPNYFINNIKGKSAQISTSGIFLTHCLASSIGHSTVEKTKSEGNVR